MYFGFSEEEKMIKKSLRDLLRKEASIDKVRGFLDRPRLSKELHARISELGLGGMIAKEGSRYEGIVMALAAFEEAGRALLPYPLLENVLAAYTLSMDPSHEKEFAEVLEGDKVATIAWHANGVPYAVEKEGKYSASGSFYSVPFAQDADYVLACFEIQGTGLLPSHQKAFVILDRNDPKVICSAERSMDQTYPLYRLEVSDYTFGKENLVVAAGQGTRLMVELDKLAALLAGAEMLGISDEILTKTVEYTKVRKQFGQEIAKFQIMKHMAADMYVMVESTRAAVMYAGWSLENGTEPETVSLAKAYASDASTKVTGMSIQMHGGIGYTWESDIHLFFKRARRLAGSFGDAYAHRERVLQAVEQSAGV